MENKDTTKQTLFNAPLNSFNQSSRLVTLLGAYLSQAELLEAHGLLAYVDKNGIADIAEVDGMQGHSWQSISHLRQAVRTTRTLAALNDGRVWARKQLAARLSPLLQEGIAVATVPSHDPFNTDTPIRRLAQALAQEGGRIDATGGLVRHTKINRIVFGGKSTPRLHEETIHVQNAELIAGQRVLLLDDIVRSGVSLRTCRDLLYASGAVVVQAAALGVVQS